MTLTTEELREPWCLKCGRKASDHNVRHPFQPSHELPSIHDLAAENATFRAEVKKLRECIVPLLLIAEGVPHSSEYLNHSINAARAALAALKDPSALVT